MNPNVTYEQLVNFVGRVASLGHISMSPPQGYGNTSQQLHTMANHLATIENRLMTFDTFIGEARNMITHGGSINGSIKRPTKTNTLTVR